MIFAYSKSLYLNLLENVMLKTLAQSLSILFLLISLSGCIAATIVSGAVDITTTAVGGAIDVVDAVTPDILDDEDDDEDDKKEKSDEENQ